MNWVTVLGFLNKVIPWLALAVAYFAGKKAVLKDLQLANAEKQKEYAEIKSEERTDKDTIDRINDGTF